MVKTNSLKDLTVWQKAHLFVLSICDGSINFPKGETYALPPQIRRTAVSIAANIAEGYKKRTLPNKIHFLNISEGSLEEVRILISGYNKFLQQKKP